MVRFSAVAACAVVEDYGRADRCYTKARRLVAYIRCMWHLNPQPAYHGRLYVRTTGSPRGALLEVDRALALPNAGSKSARVTAWPAPQSKG